MTATKAFTFHDGADALAFDFDGLGTGSGNAASAVWVLGRETGLAGVPPADTADSQADALATALSVLIPEGFAAGLLPPPVTGGDSGGGSGGTGDSGGSGSKTSTYLSGKDTPDGYNIELVFRGDNWTKAIKTEFKTAAETISDIITGDVANTLTEKGIAVDDLRLKVKLGNIDGTHGVLGWAGPTEMREDGTYLPLAGKMKFDSSDVSDMLSGGTLDDVVLHEMLHTLGFGTIWEVLGLVTDYSGDLRFTGSHATEAYNDVYAGTAADDPLSYVGVPVETDGGLGTAESHWDEETFGKELMTGYLGNKSTLSDMTVASLEDIGYLTSLYDHFPIG